MPTPGHEWLFRAWDEDAVVFNSASGDTHYLQPLTFVVYQTCCQNPGLSKSEIIDLLTLDNPAPSEADFAQRANDAMTNLQRIGLLHIP